MFQKRKSCSSLLNKLCIILFFLLEVSVYSGASQCLSSVNPVGWSNNLLILEKQSLRVISFFKHNYGNQYYEGNKQSDFDLIESANYNYTGSVIGYGLADKITIESEIGYFFNKTQHYNTDPAYSLKGSGFSNAVLSAKFGLLKNNPKRLFISTSVGLKIPFSTYPISRGGVELPIEVQPTSGALGMVGQLFIVKEVPASGIRYFITSRIESNSRNRQEYKLGTSMSTSFFFSKHLMIPWLKGDWTTILQIRNELRNKDKTLAGLKESSGGSIFYFSPQINYFIKEKWNVSVIVDLPVYQYFNGTQLSSKYGISLNFARDFKL